MCGYEKMNIKTDYMRSSLSFHAIVFILAINGISLSKNS
jgi:hypothetical protein